MILLSSLIKLISLMCVLALSGGVGYYYYATNPTEVGVKKERLVDINQHVKHHSSTNFKVGDHEFHHKCVHGEYIKTLNLEVPEQIESPIEATFNHEQELIKNHQQGNWHNIRILADYSNLEQQIKNEQLSFIKDKLIRASIGFLQAALKVYPSQKWSLGSSCNSYSIPSNLQTMNEYDLGLFIGATTSLDDWMTRAGACRFDSMTMRPVAGTLEINLAYLNELNLNEPNDKTWITWVQTIIHEMIHVLGFSSSVFQYYVNPVNNQRLGISNVVTTSEGRDWIITPKVLEQIKNHFACTSAIGAPLENEGGSGTAGH